MLYLGGVTSLIIVGLWLYCIINVLFTPESECRNLPKLAWVGIVLFLPTIGSIAWLIAGRPQQNTAAGGTGFGTPAGAGARSRFPEYDRPGRFAASRPDDDEAFLAQVRERAERQRRTEAQRRREREQAERAHREQRDQARRERNNQSDTD